MKYRLDGLLVMVIGICLIAAAALLLGGCASTRKPDPRVTQAGVENDIRRIVAESNDGCLGTLPQVRWLLSRVDVLPSFVAYCDGSTMVVAYEVWGMPDQNVVRLKMRSR